MGIQKWSQSFESILLSFLCFLSTWFLCFSHFAFQKQFNHTHHTSRLESSWTQHRSFHLTPDWNLIYVRLLFASLGATLQLSNPSIIGFAQIWNFGCPSSDSQWQCINANTQPLNANAKPQQASISKWFFTISHIFIAHHSRVQFPRPIIEFKCMRDSSDKQLYCKFLHLRLTEPAHAGHGSCHWHYSGSTRD